MPSATTADPRDLSTVDDVKEYAKITGTQDDDLLQQMLTGLSVDWLRRTGSGSLNSIAAYNEWYDGNDSTRMFVKNAPILQVFQVKVGTTTIPPSLDHIQGGWVIDQDRGSLSIICGPYPYPSGWPTYRFCAGRQNVNIAYLAGYSLISGEPQKVPPASGPYTVTANEAATFVLDAGVLYTATALPLAKVATAPNQGQYSVSAAGVYTFNAADAGAAVTLFYGASGVPPDLQDAVNRVVGLNYRRQNIREQASKNLKENGTLSFRDWEMPPECMGVLQRYTRQALV
jgi:hypothetical protein